MFKAILQFFIKFYKIDIYYYYGQKLEKKNKIYFKAFDNNLKKI